MTSPNQSLPTDADLMCYLDGELEEVRRAEVEAYLEQNAEARAKLDGLELVGELLRESVEDDLRAEGLADAVMERVEAEPAPAELADEGAEVIPFPDPPEEGATDSPIKPGRPANDNARGIFALAAVAAAAAVALFIWGRGDAGVEPVAVRSATTEAPVMEAAPTPPPSPSGPVLAEAEADTEEPAGVEVAAVDFGGRSGSVFYVPTGPEEGAATTAVVWVTDDVPGE